MSGHSDRLGGWKSGSVRLAVGEALHLLSPVLVLAAPDARELNPTTAKITDPPRLLPMRRRSKD
eukprot:2115193-Amphidinium_carterae.2